MGYRQPQPQNWPQYQAQLYPQFYQQQKPQYQYDSLGYSNLDYPVVGYDLAHNGLPSFPDVVYLDTSGQYDQSVFQLTQGIFSSEPSESITIPSSSLSFGEEDEEGSGPGDKDGSGVEEEEEDSSDSWWG